MKFASMVIAFALLNVSALHAQNQQTVTCQESSTTFEFIQEKAQHCMTQLLDEEENLEDLKSILNTYKDEKHIIFEGHKILALPSATFEQNKNLRSLTLKSFSLDLLLEPNYADSNYNSAKLKGFDNLETFDISDAQLLFGWKWSEMGQNLPNLKNIKITNSDLYYVSTDLLNLAQSLRYLSIEKSMVYWTEEITVTDNLEWVSLSHNNLENIPEDFIANNAPKLWYLDLSHNALKTLPDGFTKNMPALQELNLSHNNLEYITEDVLKPVWPSLRYLWINDNPLEISANRPDLCFLAMKVHLEENFETDVMYWYAAYVDVDGTNTTFSRTNEAELKNNYCQNYYQTIKNI